MDMNAVFNATEATPVDTAATADDKAAKSAKVKQMKAALNETIQSDPDFSKKLRRLSNSIKVVNTLGFGTKGNIVRDKNAPVGKDGKRALKEASLTCGYVIENIGTEAIEYQTEEFAQNEEGKYVGTKVTRTIAPGEQVALTRMYMTIFCAQPEISFTLANGKIVGSSKKNIKSVEDELSAYYFKFSEAEDGTTPNVNDDEIKLSVDDANGVVKPEYVKTFGYLNNPKEVKAKKATAKSAGLTTQDLVANYVNSLVKQGL